MRNIPIPRSERMLLRIQRLNLELKFPAVGLDGNLSMLLDNLSIRPNTIKRLTMSSSTTPNATTTLLSKLTTPNRGRPKLVETNAKRVVLTKDDKETAYEIKFDLNRTDFSCFENQTQARQKIERILNRLVKMLSSGSTTGKLGYWQGMNYIVTSIYRVCRCESLTMMIMYRMLNSEEHGLKQVYKENGIHDLCFVLKKYLQINVNEVYSQMETHGVDADFFALTWIVTWMFHFRSSNTDLTSFQETMERVTDEFQATILDLLCLDGIKALIKIPICLLKPVHECIAYRASLHSSKAKYIQSLEQLDCEIRAEATSFSC